MIKVLFARRPRTALIVIVLLVIVSLNAIENPVRGVVWSIFASTQSALWRTGDSFSDRGEEVFNAAGLKAENERLLLENAGLQQEVGEFKGVQEENIRLRETL